MRIARLWSQVNWTPVWKNLWEAHLPESRRAAWYKVIHDILPTNDRLHKIRMTSTDSCRICYKKDTLEHCPTEEVMGLDETAINTDAKKSPVSHSWRMANVPTVRTMAPDTSPYSIMADGKSHNIPHSTTRPNFTRLHRFPETDNLEAVSVGEKERELGKLPHNHRHHQ